MAYPPNLSNHATTVENFPGDEIEPEASSHLNSESEISSSNSKNRAKPHDNHQEIPEIYHIETGKTRPSYVNPEISKYLEAPKRPIPFSKTNYNQHFKRSNTPKPSTTSSKRPQRPLRRRIPLKNLRDLTQSESTYGQSKVPVPTTKYTVETTTSYATTRDVSRRINYNYHPIIDFFDPVKIESRVDTFGMELGDTDWRPVTSINVVTERSQFKSR